MMEKIKQAVSWQSASSTQLKEGLAALAIIEARGLDPIDCRKVRAALESAQRDALKSVELERLLLSAQRLYQDQARELESAQRDAEAWEAIEAWQLAHPECGPTFSRSASFHFVQMTDAQSVVLACFDGRSRIEALEAAATWCRAKMAK